MINDIKTKKCKYCMSDIDIKAKICPNCKKSQTSSGENIFVGVIIGIIIILVVCYFGFVANNDAPVEVRKVVCELGIRDDYPYCYYVDTDKLNELLNS